MNAVTGSFAVDSKNSIGIVLVDFKKVSRVIFYFVNSLESLKEIDETIVGIEPDSVNFLEVHYSKNFKGILPEGMGFNPVVYMVEEIINLKNIKVNYFD